MYQRENIFHNFYICTILTLFKSLWYIQPISNCEEGVTVRYTADSKDCPRQFNLEMFDSFKQITSSWQKFTVQTDIHAKCLTLVHQH